jgi:integrase
METKRHPVNLKQYRKVNGKWQFVAVARDARGRPDPRIRRELEWFRSHCRKRYVAELDRSDAMRLFVEGRKEVVDGRPLNQKTINRRIIIMLNAMRSQGAVIEMKKGDWPKTIDKKIEIYQPEELKKFFDSCDPDERLVFQVFLCTGFREREVATLAWSDVHWRGGKLGVSAKPDLGFTPKSYEERSVPVPMALIERHVNWRARSAALHFCPHRVPDMRRKTKWSPCRWKRRAFF